MTTLWIVNSVLAVMMLSGLSQGRNGVAPIVTAMSATGMLFIVYIVYCRAYRSFVFLLNFFLFSSVVVVVVDIVIFLVWLLVIVCFCNSCLLSSFIRSLPYTQYLLVVRFVLFDCSPSLHQFVYFSPLLLKQCYTLNVITTKQIKTIQPNKLEPM